MTAAGFAARQDAEDEGHETRVVVRRHGEGIFPVEVVTEFEDGYRAREGLGRPAAAGRSSPTTVPGAGDAGVRGSGAQAAARRRLYEQQPHAGPAGPRGGDQVERDVAGLAVQDLLLTYGFFI